MQICCVSVRTIDRFQKKRLLPGYSIGGTGHRRFRADDVDRLLVPNQNVDQRRADLKDFISQTFDEG